MEKKVKPPSSAEPVSCLQRDETWSCLRISRLATNESNGAVNRWGRGRELGRKGQEEKEEEERM